MEIVIVAVVIVILIISVYNLFDNIGSKEEIDTRLNVLQEQLDDIEDKLNRKK